MHETGLLIELGTVLIAALVGGFIARSFKLPVLIGYIVAGIVVGPYTPGFSPALSRWPRSPTSASCC